MTLKSRILSCDFIIWMFLFEMFHISVISHVCVSYTEFLLYLVYVISFSLILLSGCVLAFFFFFVNKVISFR